MHVRIVPDKMGNIEVSLVSSFHSNALSKRTHDGLTTLFLQGDDATNFVNGLVSRSKVKDIDDGRAVVVNLPKDEVYSIFGVD